MVKVISSREGGYFISFSETQTPEEWNLIQQAKELERKQNTEQYAKSVQPELAGGIDWKFFRTGKRTQPVQETVNPVMHTVSDEFLNSDEWVDIITPEDWKNN